MVQEELCTIPADLAEVASAVTSVGISFLSLLAVADTSSHCTFVSPVSIYYALVLALNAAGPQSSTYGELRQLMLGSTASELTEAGANSKLGQLMELLVPSATADGADPTKVSIANGIWAHRGLALQEPYTSSMKSLFGATAQSGGPQEVNQWVASATQGMIKDFLPDDAQFDALLANALYFKGLWQTPFKEEATTSKPFTTAAGAVKQVPSMERLFEPRDQVKGVREDGVYEALRLGYQGGSYAAVIMLPVAGVTPATALASWARDTNKGYSNAGRVRLQLPKFKVSSSASLANAIKAAGATTMFGAGADFSRLSSEPLYVTEVLHKVVVDVDEKGTEAAAATGIMMTRSMPLPPHEFVVDRPFVFIIVHASTNLPLFAGVVNDPSPA